MTMSRKRARTRAPGTSVTLVERQPSVAAVAANLSHPPTYVMDGIEADVVNVTPTMAMQWLERGGENRPITQRHVNRLADAMRRNEWRLTGEAIKLNSEGRVKDGQHRLWAIIESGVTIRTLVVLNVPDDAFDVMDTGRMRSVADILALHGVEASKISAAGGRTALMWELSGTPHGTGRHTITAPQVMAYLQAHDDFHSCLLAARGLTERAGIPGGNAVWTAVIHRFNHVDPLLTETFINALRTGSDLKPGNPVLALRNRLMLPTMRKAEQNEIAALAIKAWNAMRKNRPLAEVRWRRDETFPEVE